MADIGVNFLIYGKEDQKWEWPEGTSQAFVDEVRSSVEGFGGRFGDITKAKVNFLPSVSISFTLPNWGKQERAYVSGILADLLNKAFDNKTGIGFHFDHLQMRMA
jgi:hypothetical protein